MNEHVVGLIRRNLAAYDSISEYRQEDRKKFLTNVKWAEQLNAKLNNLDYEERAKAVSKIVAVLDNDYVTLAGKTLTVEPVEEELGMRR